MLATIESLRDIRRRCMDREPLSREQSEWLGRALAAFLDHRSPTVDAALGLAFPRGGVPWWLEEAMRKRNAALRALAAACFPDHCPSAQSERVWEMTHRYAASAWRFDSHRADMPAHYAGTPKQYLWQAFVSGAAMPLGKRQLRSILAG